MFAQTVAGAAATTLRRRPLTGGLGVRLRHATAATAAGCRCRRPHPAPRRAVTPRRLPLPAVAPRASRLRYVAFAVAAVAGCCTPRLAAVALRCGCGGRAARPGGRRRGNLAALALRCG